MECDIIAINLHKIENQPIEKIIVRINNLSLEKKLTVNLLKYIVNH